MNTGIYKEKMLKTIEHIRNEFSTLQVGRATSGLVDSIKVDAGYGAMAMNQVANIVIMDNATLKVEPWDKTITAAIEKSIYDADTGLVPQ